MDLPPLKLKQIDAMKSFESGKDTFVSFPTGYGKLFCHGSFDYMHSNLPQFDYSIAIINNCDYSVLTSSRISIDTHQKSVALETFRPVNCFRLL